MTDFLINTENIYLKRGICELLLEIAIEENIRTPFSLHEYSPEFISQTDVLFTEMETGEHYLCHPCFKKVPQQTPIFVFVPSDSGARVDRLPLCLRDATFISINADLRSIKNQIANRLTASSKPVAGGPEKDSKRCLKCPRLTLTKSQLYIIDAIKTGMNNQQIAQELGISHKTVFSHKINIMKKFQIDTKQELARFSAIALALSSRAIN
ncbi:response regulator transcription factor [Klebsiella variicola]|uniref:helix-turn-helix transcriptional regulator n=1 Tax=Klebsiella variicola TaxID=244366 RepID=UPI00109C6F80|nr:LuxR C-terminal-related transcriptional regulator [Klebsiella variicola]QHW97554.1 response regulator transcription factor [Klebsiella variicola]VGP90090.1 Transcriptional regulatory protein RcsA [Klebsiella variicola]